MTRRILSLDDARSTAELSRQARAHLAHASVASDVVDRVHGVPTDSRMLLGEESRGAKIGDVLRLLGIALEHYDSQANESLVAYIEYRLSLVGRLAAMRRRWTIRAAHLTRWVMAQHPAIDRAVRAIHARVTRRSTGSAG